MRGGLGNLVVLLPNGLSAFRFADGGHYDVDPMVLAGEAIRSFPCPAGFGEASPPARQPLPASVLRAELPGHTFYTVPMNFFIAADGVLYATVKGGPEGGTEHDVGAWYITLDGQWCRTWNVWDGRQERCHAVYREGETFEFSLKDRFGKAVFRRVPGIPEGY